MFGAAETAFSELSYGDVRRIVSENNENILMAMSAGKSSVVVVIFKSTDDIDSVSSKLEHASTKIEEIMG